MIKKIAEKINVVILNFNKGRAWGSKSEFPDMPDYRTIIIYSSHKQAILIKYAAEKLYPLSQKIFLTLKMDLMSSAIFYLIKFPQIHCFIQIHF